MKLFFRTLYFSIFIYSHSISFSQTLLKPDRVFDGEILHTNWVVLVQENKITFAGELANLTKPENTKEIDLKGMTLLPGLIEGHSHLFLHPYNEASWNRQVLVESPTERTIRATVHAKKTLLAGVTTMRDLGTEGAGYADVYLKESIKKGIVPGPRIIAAGPAIVATGSYGPKGYHSEVKVPLGAQTADGTENIIKTVREQIGNGVDVIKVYADAHWGIEGKEMPTFSETELNVIVSTASSVGRPVVAHASSYEGMKRAINAGVETIEHGDNGTLELFQLMAKKGIALCPTLAANEAMAEYGGWKKGKDKEPETIKTKKDNFKLALKSGVTICFGGDVGVFAHGDNVRELELMVEYGMKDIDALKSATSINANVFHLNTNLGFIKNGLLADIIAVQGNPTEHISDLKQVKFVMKDGQIIN